MFTVIAYDISDDRRRLRAANVLLDYGFRVQKSVFEALLTDAQLEALLGRLRGTMDLGADAVRLYRLCAACRERILALGATSATTTDDVIIL